MRCCNCVGGPCLVGWCERGDSNPHGLLRQVLSLVRLPIPPLSRGVEGTNFLGRSCPLWTTELYRVSSAGDWAQEGGYLGRVVVDRTIPELRQDRLHAAHFYLDFNP